MKKILFPLFVIASVSIVSCSKDKVAPLEGETVATMTLDAYAADATRTHLDGLTCKWSEGDAITVNGQTSTGIEIKEGGACATFTLPVVEAPYYGLYPASAFVADSYAPASSKYGSVTLPKIQNYVAGSFDPAAAVLLGAQETAGKGIHFTNAMAYLKLTLAAGATTAAISEVQIEANSGENLSGTFTIDKDYTALTNAGTAKAPVTLNCGESGAALGTALIIAIPAKTYATGLSIKVKDLDGKYQITKSSREFVAAAGRIYPTSFTFVPQGTEIEGGIYTAADWDSFVAQVGAGNDFSGKTITLMNDLSTPSFFDYKKGTFNGTLDGNGHTMTASANKWPLLEILGSQGVIKNLTVAGEISGKTQAALANPAMVGNAVFVKQNLGTISGCTNKTNTKLTAVTGAVVFGYFCTQNCGKIENCVNEGDITISGTCASAGLYGGGIAAAGHGLVSSYPSPGPGDADSDLPSGTFTNCTNKGNIEVSLTGGATPPVKCAVGGICGVAYKDGVKFDGCINEGSVSKYDKGVTATNNACCTGGICGRAAGTNSATNLAVDAQNGYKIEFTNCTNKGQVSNLSRISRANWNLASETGARKVYVGGIAGMIVGSKSDASKRASVSGCRNTGDIASGWNGVSSNTPGGIAGCATNVNVTGCTVCCKIYSSDTDKAGSSAKRYIAAAGGIAGVTFGNLVAEGGSYYVEGSYYTGTDKWQGLLLGLNYGKGSSFTGMQTGGTISRNGTAENINETNYTDYCLGNNATVSGTAAPTFTGLSYLSAKPEE